MITPVDLETTVFRRGWRGYNTREIQDFMTKITHDYEFLYRENINLKEKIDELTTKLSQYQLMEENLRNAIVLAQKTAEDVKGSAQTQATSILREAGQQSEEIKMRVRGEIQSELQNLATLRNQVEFFRCQFKSFLQTLLEAAEKQPNVEIAWNDLTQKIPQIQNYSIYNEAAATSEKNPEPKPTENDDFKTENEKQQELKLGY